MICHANGIEHRLTRPNPPWTNGQVERINRTIKDATVKRYHDDNHDQLRTHSADFMAAYNFARGLKTLNGLTPYEYICKIRTSEPDKFNGNPIYKMTGLNNQGPARRPAPVAARQIPAFRAAPPSLPAAVSAGRCARILRQQHRKRPCPV